MIGSMRTIVGSIIKRTLLSSHWYVNGFNVFELRDAKVNARKPALQAFFDLFPRCKTKVKLLQRKVPVREAWFDSSSFTRR